MSSLLSSQNSNKDNSNKYNQTLTKHAPAAEKTVAAEVDTEKKTSKDGESELNVNWDGDDDPSDPYNWSGGRRLLMTIIISLGGLVTLMSTSMLAPALADIEHDLQIGASESNLTLSIYILALAFGPLIISPLSELLGRKPVYLACHGWYILWNALCPVGKIRGLLVVGRFFSGLGSSVGLALSGPIMADMWKPEKRGISYATVNFTPLLGVAIGPILGGFITNGLGWPWLFWIVSIWDGAILTLGIFFIHESYKPTLLTNKARMLRQRTGKNYTTEFERSHPTLANKLKITMVRPIRMLFNQPIVQVMTVFLAYNFGVYCIAISTFADMWMMKYHESASTSGLNYIAIATGAALASTLGGVATDKVWTYLKAKAGGSVTPEYRVPLMIPGAIFMPAGLFWYGWSIDRHLMWLMPDIGAGIFAFGSIMSQQATITYVVEIFGVRSASAVAAVRMLSNIFGFAFPLFVTQLYVALGYGWGNSLLAFLFLAMGVPAPLLLWKYGARIRAAGKDKE